MPYLEESRREALDKFLISMDKGGDLNYLTTQLCQTFLEIKGESYATYNEIIGALECCKLELYRRKVALYEDKAIARNGDVWL